MCVYIYTLEKSTRGFGISGKLLQLHVVAAVKSCSGTSKPKLRMPAKFMLGSSTTRSEFRQLHVSIQESVEGLCYNVPVQGDIFMQLMPLNTRRLCQVCMDHGRILCPP